MSSTSEAPVRRAGALFPSKCRATLTGGLQGMSVATAADNPDILAFVEAREMDLGADTLAVNYRRAPDYFAFLSMQGPEEVVYLQRDEQGQIKGLGSFTYLERHVAGRKVVVGYVGDLRIAAYRRGRVQWRKQYALQLEAAREAGVRAHFTAILDDNVAARRALVDEASKKNAYVYRPLFRYVMVNALARIPVASQAARAAVLAIGARREGERARGLAVRSARSADEGVLRAFLQDTRGPKRLFGENYIGDGWAFRLRAWPGFRLADFLLATNARGEILACCLPWSPRGAKGVVVDRLPRALKALRSLVNAMGHAPPIPGEGGAIEFLYLTHLAFAPGLDSWLETALLSAFLEKARARAKAEGFHMVSYHEAAVSLRRTRLARLGEILQVVPATLYDVREREAAQEDLAATDPHGEPCFEMALI